MLVWDGAYEYAKMYQIHKVVLKLLIQDMFWEWLNLTNKHSRGGGVI